MIPVVASVVRDWCRMYVGPPLRAVDRIASIRAGGFELCLFRHRKLNSDGTRCRSGDHSDPSCPYGRTY